MNSVVVDTAEHVDMEYCFCLRMLLTQPTFLKLHLL